MGCLNKRTSSSSRGFQWKAGEKPCTKGINMLSKPFKIPNPQKSGEKMVVLLVDCEGLQASDSVDGTDQVLFGLSNLMSSMLIVNQKGQVSTNDLRCLGVLAEFCPPSKNKTGGKTTSIEILMRDFKYETSKLNSQLTEISKFKEVVTKPKEEGTKYV